MNRVIHFEIHADDPERAIRFYHNVFGWKIQKWGEQGYWFVGTGPDADPGIHGSLQKRMGLPPVPGQPVNGFINTIEVTSLDAVSTAILANGGEVALPKISLPGVGYTAYFTDTEGNIFGIHQPDVNAL